MFLDKKDMNRTQTNRWTDGRGDSYIPHQTLLAGGIIILYYFPFNVYFGILFEKTCEPFPKISLVETGPVVLEKMTREKLSMKQQH